MPRTPGSCDHNYFAVVEREEQAYWLGFISADACIYRNQLILALRDAEHVVKFRQALRIENQVRQYVRCTNYGLQTLALVTVTSLRLLDTLAALGVTRVKSTTIHPAPVPAGLARHYWRGWIDGDGTLSLTGKSLTLGLVGTRSVCEGFASFCRGIVATNSGVRRHKSIWAFTLSDRNARMVAAAMYDGAECYLDRKRRVYFRAIDLNPPRVLKHGTTGYRRGCRCGNCTIAHREAARNRVRRLRYGESNDTRPILGKAVGRHC